MFRGHFGSRCDLGLTWSVRSHARARDPDIRWSKSATLVRGGWASFCGSLVRLVERAACAGMLENLGSLAQHRSELEDVGPLLAQSARRDCGSSALPSVETFSLLRQEALLRLRWTMRKQLWSVRKELTEHNRILNSPVMDRAQNGTDFPTVDAPLPQIQEAIGEVIFPIRTERSAVQFKERIAELGGVILQERTSLRTVEEIMDLPVCQDMGHIVDVPKPWESVKLSI